MIFTEADGVQVAPESIVVVPAGSRPTYGEASVAAHALLAGACSNIQAGDLNTACCYPSMLVKNTAFTGGRESRDFPAVAPHDRDLLASQVKRPRRELSAVHHAARILSQGVCIVTSNDMPQYQGKRALILTRVSTARQEEKYSHAAQERQVREKLVRPLGLRIVDEERHIIRDTYSGLEYRYREALERILEMAEQGEFDVLCMDVLDRGLGRRALAREIYRMQLNELGIRVLTTDPSDHADDDSLAGQIMRFHKGVKAEEEVIDLVRRTRDGRREKVLGNAEKEIPQQIIGGGLRLYGYHFVLSEKGIRIGYALNLDVIHLEPDGIEWTEAKVVVFIYESAANGVSTHQITAMLNEKGIPTPYSTKGRRQKGMKEDPVWQTRSIQRILKNAAYYGEYRQFKCAIVGHMPGHKYPVKRQTSEDEQIIIPIPAIVTKELWEKANRRVAANRQLATRTNQTSKEGLLQGGFAKCAYCKCSLHVERIVRTHASGEEVAQFHYNCSNTNLKGGKCSGCFISVDSLDKAVTEYIVEIIRDSSVVDKKIEKMLVESPISKRQQGKLKNLNAICHEQTQLRNNLSRVMRQETFDAVTIAFLNRELQLLEQQAQEAEKELADEQRVQQQRENLERCIVKFREQCTEVRGQLDNPQFLPPFTFQREALLFLGISVTAWRSGIKPRYEIYTDHPKIMELLSKWTILPRPF